MPFQKCIIFMSLLTAGCTEVCDVEAGRCFWVGMSAEMHFSETPFTLCSLEIAPGPGEVATLDSQAAYDAAVQAAQDSDGLSFNVWVSAHDGHVESIFRWGNGKPLTYDAWASGYQGQEQPDGEKAQNCLALTSAGFLDDHCVNSRKSLCSRNINSNATTCTSLQDGCGGNVTDTTDGLSFLPMVFQTSYKKTRVDAVQFCEGAGMELLTIRTPEKEQVVADEIAKHGSFDLLLDLTDQTVETVFRWQDSDIITWERWEDWEPGPGQDEDTSIFNDVSGHDCVIRTSAGKWRDVSCDVPQYFMCQSKSPAPDTNTDTKRLGTKYTYYDGVAMNFTLMDQMSIRSKLQCAGACDKANSCKAIKTVKSTDSTLCLLLSDQGTGSYQATDLYTKVE